MSANFRDTTRRLIMLTTAALSLTAAGATVPNTDLVSLSGNVHQFARATVRCRRGAEHAATQGSRYRLYQDPRAAAGASAASRRPARSEIAAIPQVVDPGAIRSTVWRFRGDAYSRDELAQVERSIGGAAATRSRPSAVLRQQGADRGRPAHPHSSLCGSGRAPLCERVGALDTCLARVRHHGHSWLERLYPRPGVHPLKAGPRGSLPGWALRAPGLSIRPPPIIRDRISGRDMWVRPTSRSCTTCSRSTARDLPAPA